MGVVTSRQMDMSAMASSNGDSQSRGIDTTGGDTRPRGGAVGNGVAVGTMVGAVGADDVFCRAPASPFMANPCDD